KQSMRQTGDGVCRLPLTRSITSLHRELFKNIPESLYAVSEGDYTEPLTFIEEKKEKGADGQLSDAEIRKLMESAAGSLDFERAAYFRDVLRSRGKDIDGGGIKIAGKATRSRKKR
ncbi:hypothetical protein B1A_11489, partial [mine drainage metagenome]